MIAKIAGKVSVITYDSVIVDVCGLHSCILGYEVIVSKTDLASFVAGMDITLYIRHIFKEDGQYLYGFRDMVSRLWFDEFLKLNGLGARIALGILSVMTCDNIVHAISIKDEKMFTTISGIGGKLANRIVNEMQNVPAKISKLAMQFVFTTSEPYSHNVDNIPSGDVVTPLKEVANNQSKVKLNDVIEVLTQLGFSRNSVYSEVYNLANKHHNSSIEDLVKLFLSNHG